MEPEQELRILKRLLTKEGISVVDDPVLEGELHPPFKVVVYDPAATLRFVARSLEDKDASV